MSVSLLTRRVAGLALRSAGASRASPAVASSLSALSGSGPASVSSPGGGDIRGIGIGIGAGGGPQHRQQQMRGMSKKSKRAGGDDLVSNSCWLVCTLQLYFCAICLSSHHIIYMSALASRIPTNCTNNSRTSSTRSGSSSSSPSPSTASRPARSKRLPSPA